MTAQTVSQQPRPEAAEAAKKNEKIDFKMVTFSLAGKEYGIDIMSVKEIAKANRFTYVPNAAPFVRGVYNLRGDIISVIDLRIFFHLPAERKQEEAFENLIILKLGEHVFGVIVDGIDKVVGITASAIQPPHPIFGDINVKYIKGIVENGGKLYIILDVERIFAQDRSAAAEEALPQREAEEQEEEAHHVEVGGDVAASFIRENLAALRDFHVTSINAAWFEKRYAGWKNQRKNDDLQIKEVSDADQFLEGFWSPCTGSLWSDEYALAVEKALPPIEGKSINVWNPGCGKGFETWSLACIMRKRYPEVHFKIWANDSDLLAISMAPNMVFPDSVPEYYAPFLTEGRNGRSFAQAVRDSIFFEYHDIMNTNPLPPLDIVLCRDVLSFMPPIDQKRLLGDIIDKMKQNGLLILGANEAMGEGWAAVGNEAVPMFRRA